VENRRPVTEEDILLTEMLIARSIGRLKQSVAQEASRTLRSVGGTVKEHPYATAGAAIGAGVILYGLFRLLTRNGSSGRSLAAGLEKTARSNMTREIFSLIMPLVIPYITAFAEKNLGRMFSKDRK
jgi:hypothetical protein